MGVTEVPSISRLRSYLSTPVTLSPWRFWATTAYEFNNHTYSGFIRETCSRRLSSFIAAYRFSALIVLSIFNTIVHTVRFFKRIRRLSHDTRTVLVHSHNKSSTFVENSRNFVVLVILRISYDLPQVSYEFLR